jgi:sulfoxide reductase heme-binding subunit YedZ
MRHDLFGLANYTGLAAAFVLLALLATSNDAALRRLSTAGWKQLQRWNYVCFALTAIHTLTYQTGIETQTLGFVVLAVLCVLLTAMLQLIGLQRRCHTRTENKSRLGRSPNRPRRMGC